MIKQCIYKFNYRCEIADITCNELIDAYLILYFIVLINILIIYVF